MAFQQVADALSDDPVVSGQGIRCLLQIAQQLGARAYDVLSLVRNDVIGEVGMPLAKPANDQAVIRCPDVEPWQHLPPPPLEYRLQVARVFGNRR